MPELIALLWGAAGLLFWLAVNIYCSKKGGGK
jgi:hypothetical protein